MNSLADPTVSELLERLHSEADAQMPELRDVLNGSAVRGGPEAQEEGDQAPESYFERLQDFYLPVNREQGRFLYQTVRAVRPERVVEFGSSFGVSAIYLAAGLRDNGAGTLVGSELIEKKAATARKNLAAAGLDDLVDIRTGDARQTLKDPGGPIDIVLLDGGPALYAEILHMLVPNLRPGALVIADNVDDEDHPYPTWVRDPAHGFVSSSITLKGGTEYSIWTGTATQQVATP
jgi:predicted O-methyltransferase YrrM